jgi:very-short-patch-repair endonuclease
VRKIIPYDSRLKEFARKLRNKSSLPEILLWKKLKKKALGGYDFHRQKPLLNFIADFYCHELNMVIEVDGKQHYTIEHSERDARRDSVLKEHGIFILRIPVRDVLSDMEMTVELIKLTVEKREKELGLVK